MSIYNKPSILDEINGFSDCDVAFLTTYNFEIPFFDRTILPMLARSKARVCVFADSNRLQEAINEFGDNRDTGLGRHYFVYPFKTEKSFHPKVILLLGKKKSKLIVSSANLKYSSHFQNNELFQSFDYDENDTQYENLFNQAFSFIKDLADEAKNEYVDKLIEYTTKNYSFLLKGKEINVPLLLTSFPESIVSQLRKHIKEDVKSIKAAVPFYDDELVALKEMKRAFNNPEITLYIQDACSTFPKEQYSNDLIAEAKIFNKINNNNEQKGEFYHGKLFSFITDTKEYVLYGSANFSASALLRSYKTGGNIEASILDKGELGYSNELFNSFLVTDNFKIEELKVREIETSAVTINSDLAFINGCVEDGIVKLLIKSSVEPTRIAINNREIETFTKIGKGNNQYLLCFSLVGTLDKNVFDLTVLNYDPPISVRCFVCDYDYLSLYVDSKTKNPFKDLKTDEDMENRKKTKFLEQLEIVMSDVKRGIHEKKIKQIPPSLSDVNDDTQEDESEEEEQFDASLYETPDYVLSIDNNEIYHSALGYLSYYSKKTAAHLTTKHTRKKNTGKITIETQEEKETRERKKQTYINAVLSWFGKCAREDNELFDGLDFELYFKTYEMFSDEFIKDIYLDRTCQANEDRLTEIKINYLINRLIPSIDKEAKSSEHFEYFKKEVALLCLECYRKNPSLFVNLKEALLKLDKQAGGAFINELKRQMKEVGEILEIRYVGSRIDYFNRFIFDSPDEKQFKKIISDYFCFSSSDLYVQFDEELLKLTITINRYNLKEGSDMVMSLSKGVRQSVLDFIERCYGIKDDGGVTFEIDVFNCKKQISDIRYIWDRQEGYKKYTRIINYVENNKQDKRTLEFNNS